MVAGRTLFSEVNKSINSIGLGQRINYLGPLRRMSMEAVTEYADKKAELEQRIGSLEAEKASLLSDIASIKEKLVEMELERSADALQSEVEALRTERAALEEKAAQYDAQTGYKIPDGVAGV